MQYVLEDHSLLFVGDKYGDKIGGADVIFGEEGDSVLLGEFTLEALGLALHHAALASP